MHSDATRQANAGGLSEHLKMNQNHEHAEVHDDYRLQSQFDITTSMTGVYRGPRLREDSAQMLNRLLKENQLNNHVYFSETGGFHNHRVHHLLAAYALGATPKDLQLAIDTIESTQRPRFAIDKDRVEAMYTVKEFQSMLGDDRYYHTYLAFFLQKFEKQGWNEVVTEYLFSGTELADDLFIRLFAGIWHNLILVGYGIEFELPGIVAEGLAGTCVHSNVFGPYLLECESLANNTAGECKPLVELLQEIRGNPTLCDKDHWNGGNSFAYDDDLASKAPHGMSELAAQWKVDSPDDLSYRTIEMINVNAFIAGAAQRPGKVVKIDFIYVHYINASIFFSAFLEQDWIDPAIKSRLLEWFVRMELLFYASSLGPELLADEIKNYRPVDPASTWSSIIQRCMAIPDDGHLVKMIRALAHGEQIPKSWEERDSTKDTPLLPVKTGMWLQIANMAVDSVEGEGDIIRHWVRGAGSDEAWAEFPDREIQTS